MTSCSVTLRVCRTAMPLTVRARSRLNGKSFFQMPTLGRQREGVVEDAEDRGMVRCSCVYDSYDVSAQRGFTRSSAGSQHATGLCIADWSADA
jgi:hypothetical protein